MSIVKYTTICLGNVSQDIIVHFFAHTAMKFNESTVVGFVLFVRLFISRRFLVPQTIQRSVVAS
jgi:hypothetical protein